MRWRSWTAVLATGLALAGTSHAAAQQIQLPVPRITVYPGDVISDDILVDRAFPTSLGEAVHGDRHTLVGMVARFTLLPGQPIGINAVRVPQVVQQGKAALVVFQAGGLVISATAVALQSGATGDVVSLRNSESGATIRGVVQADGTIRVGLQ